MSFLKDFVGGFAAVKVADYEREQKNKDEIDLYRKKRLEDLDVSKQEIDYKAKKEAERLKELKAAIDGDTESRVADQMSTIMTPGSAQPTPSNPFSMAPDSPAIDTNDDFNEAQSWREKQARAIALGAEDFAKEYKVRSDIADERLKFSDKQREKERQDILSKDGVPILKTSAEERAKKYKEGQVESEYGRGTIFKNTTEDKAKFTDEQVDDALNDELKGIVASNLTNEVTGKLTIDQGTFNRFTKDSIRLSNEIVMAETPDQKEQAILELMDLKADMNAQQTGLGDTIIEALAGRGKQISDVSGSINQQQSLTEPVKLSADETPESIRAAYKSGQLTKEQAKQKLLEIGF